MSETAPGGSAPPQSPTPAPEPTLRSGEAPEAAQTQTAPEQPGNLLADAKPPEAEAPPESAPAEPDAPISYDFKLPEGVAKDDPLLAAYTEAAAEAKLPADVAQAVLERLSPKLTEALQAPYRLWSETQTKWQEEVKADPEIGGSRLQPTLAGIARMLDDPRYCDPGLRAALSATGAGNNPAVIRSFAKLAKAVTEGGMVPAGKPAAEAKPTAAVLYPTMQT
jgi:hypothetical protein